MKTKHNIILLMLISIMPLVLGSLLYLFHGHFNLKTVNHGTLINPVVHLQDLGIVQAKKWKIVYVPAHCCDQACDKTMFNLHQLRTLFNKDSKRIDLVVAAIHCKIKETHDFQKLTISYKQHLQFQKAMGAIDITDKIYLVDTLGNMFMYYSATVNPLDIYKDLKKVLEVSQIG